MAGASLYGSSPNSDSGGGSKKQGITSRIGLDGWSNRDIQVSSNGRGRFLMFYINQLGGVGAGRSMFGGRFGSSGGGVRRPQITPVPNPPPPPSVDNAVYLQFAGMDEPLGILQFNRLLNNMNLISSIDFENKTLLLVNVQLNGQIYEFYLPISTAEDGGVLTSLIPFVPEVSPPSLPFVQHFNFTVSVVQQVLFLQNGELNVYVINAASKAASLVETFDLHAMNDRIIIYSPSEFPYAPLQITLPINANEPSIRTQAILLYTKILDSGVYYVYISDDQLIAYPTGINFSEGIGEPCSFDQPNATVLTVNYGVPPNEPADQFIEFARLSHNMQLASSIFSGSNVQLLRVNIDQTDSVITFYAPISILPNQPVAAPFYPFVPDMTPPVMAFSREVINDTVMKPKRLNLSRGNLHVYVKPGILIMDISSTYLYETFNPYSNVDRVVIRSQSELAFVPLNIVIPLDATQRDETPAVLLHTHLDETGYHYVYLLPGASETDFKTPVSYPTSTTFSDAVGLTCSLADVAVG